MTRYFTRTATLSCLVAPLCVTPSALAEVIINATVDADARVGHGPNVNTTFGTTDPNRLVARRWGNDFLGNSDKTWVRFDLNGAAPGTITDAAFALTFLDNTGRFFEFDFEVYGLNDGLAGEAKLGQGGWDQATVTGNNAPGNVFNSSFEVDANQTTLLGSFTKPNYNTGFDQEGESVGIAGVAGSAFVDFLNADTNGVVTLIIVRTTNENVTSVFASSENTDFDGPSLTLTVIPEPGSFALLTCGSVLVLGRRRRAQPTLP
ncbi:MAG: hypothetical protein AAF750_11075 [Planctomycetota bacterium]